MSSSSTSVLVLAGGRSRRMRRDKRLISLPTDHHLLGAVLAAVRPLGLPLFLASTDHDAGRPRLRDVAV